VASRADLQRLGKRAQRRAEEAARSVLLWWSGLACKWMVGWRA
jgi:hypothetical protein